MVRAVPSRPGQIIRGDTMIELPFSPDVYARLVDKAWKDFFYVLNDNFEQGAGI